MEVLLNQVYKQNTSLADSKQVEDWVDNKLTFKIASILINNEVEN